MRRPLNGTLRPARPAADGMRVCRTFRWRVRELGAAADARGRGGAMAATGHTRALGTSAQIGCNTPHEFAALPAHGSPENMGSHHRAHQGLRKVDNHEVRREGAGICRPLAGPRTTARGFSTDRFWLTVAGEQLRRVIGVAARGRGLAQGSSVVGDDSLGLLKEEFGVLIRSIHREHIGDQRLPQPLLLTGPGNRGGFSRCTYAQTWTTSSTD